jgi:hypothetical protein
MVVTDPGPPPAPPEPPAPPRRPTMKWILLGVGVLVVLIVIGSVAGAGRSATSKANKERDLLQSTLTSTQASLEQANADLSAAKTHLTDAKVEVSDAQHEMRVAQQKAKNAETKAFKDAQAKLATQQAAVNSQAAAARQQQAAVDAARGELNATSISDGVYAIGTDVQPGTYHTSGGSNCYYAILNSTDTSDIATNDLGDGPRVATLPAGKYFDTSGCSDWVKR